MLLAALPLLAALVACDRMPVGSSRVAERCPQANGPDETEVSVHAEPFACGAAPIEHAASDSHEESTSCLIGWCESRATSSPALSDRLILGALRGHDVTWVAAASNSIPDARAQLFAIEGESTVTQFDGAAVDVTPPLWGTGENNVWTVVAARGGRILKHHDGKHWLDVPLPLQISHSNPNDSRLIAAAAGSAFLLADSTSVYRWRAGAWAIFESIDRNITAIAVQDGGTLWVGGDMLSYYDGHAWTSMPSAHGYPMRIASIAAPTSGPAWASSAVQLLRFDGGCWHAVDLPLSAITCPSVWATEEGDVWTVCFHQDGNRLWRLSAGTWHAEPLRHSPFLVYGTPEGRLTVDDGKSFLELCGATD
jgi:hypothetical protein